jgi:uncharacterized membrane protein
MDNSHFQLNQGRPGTAGLQPGKWLWIGYWLYAAGLVFGLCTIVAVILNYIKRSDLQAAGPVAASHLRWQIRTFWYTLLWAVVAAVLSVVFIGLIVAAAVAIWYIYRIIKGMVFLSDGKAMD